IRCGEAGRLKPLAEVHLRHVSPPEPHRPARQPLRRCPGDKSGAEESAFVLEAPPRDPDADCRVDQVGSHGHAEAGYPEIAFKRPADHLASVEYGNQPDEGIAIQTWKVPGNRGQYG